MGWKKWILFSSGYLGVYSGLNAWLMNGGNKQIPESLMALLTSVALLPQIFLQGLFHWKSDSPLNTFLQAPISLLWYMIIFFLVWKMIRLSFKAVGWIKWIIILGTLAVITLPILAGYLIITFYLGG